MDRESARPTVRHLRSFCDVRAGHLVDDGVWVYVWQSDRDQRVVHGGATPLSPSLRTWLHLNGSRPDVGRIAANYFAQPDEPLDVLAFVEAIRGHIVR